MPPPSASLVNGPFAWLPATRVYRRVRCPQLSIPPPPAWAKPQSPIGPHDIWESTSLVGAATLPVIALAMMVSVVAAEPSADGGTNTPPPSASNVLSKAEFVTPPVTVTSRIVTVGSLEPSIVPTVITGPPPLIVVRAGPDPSTVRLLVMANPPW